MGDAGGTRTAGLAAAVHDAHGWRRGNELGRAKVETAGYRGNISRKLPVCHILTLTLTELVLPQWQSPPGRNRYAFVSQNATSSRTRSRPSSNNVRAPSPFPAPPLIPADRRLAQQTKLLKERNASLLKAVGSVRANPSSSTVYIPGTASGEEYVAPHSHPSLTPILSV